MCANHHHLYSNRCERVGALRQGRAYVSCQIPRRSDLIGSDLHGGTTRFACDRRYPLYPTPPYYIYYTSGIWHRGAGRRTARIGTSSVPTNRDGVRYCAELDLYAIRCGPGRRACLRIGTACVLRIGTTSDTVRARMASERSGRRAIRCGYDRRVRTVRFGTTCERDGAGAAGIAGRVHGFGATGGDSDLYGRLRVRLEA